MTTRSTRLAAFSTATAGDAIIWTSPTGYVTLVKYAYYQNNASNTANPVLYLCNADNSVCVTLAKDTIVSTQLANWTGWAVLEPGDTVHLYSDQANVLIWLSGAVLPATAIPPG